MCLPWEWSCFRRLSVVSTINTREMISWRVGEVRSISETRSHYQPVSFCPSWVESSISFLVYNEELHDLLLPRSSSKSSSTQSRLELRENPRASGVHITNLTWKHVSSIDDCLKFKRQGDLARTMGSTQMNRDSSRSHTMFSLAVQCRQADQTKLVRQGKLNFVDLGR